MNHNRTLSFILAATLGLAFTTHSFASVPLDVRVAWAYNGIDDPGSYSPNPVPSDFNELKGQFTNQNQTAGDNAANLHDAIAPYGPTGVGVTWANWRRYNSNNGAAFSSDRDWADRAGSASQLAGNDDGSPTSSSVTFTGLLPNDPYQVEVVTTGIGGSVWDIEINSTNADHSFSNTQNAAVGAWNASSNGSAQRDWLVWDSAQADGSGSLTIDFFTPNNAGLDGLHAIRITGMIPEPSSLGLIGVSALFLRRQRKN